MKAMTWKRGARCHTAVSISAPTTFSTRLILSPVSSVMLARAPLSFPRLVRADRRISFPPKVSLARALFYSPPIDSKASWQEQMAVCSLHSGYINPKSSFASWRVIITGG